MVIFYSYVKLLRVYMKLLVENSDLLRVMPHVMQDKRDKMPKETRGQLIRPLASMAGMAIEPALTMAAR